MSQPQPPGSRRPDGDPPPPSGPPLPVGPPAAPGQPPPPPAPPKRSNRRRWIIAGLILLLILGGCGALAATGAVRTFRGMTAPIDVANDYLDAARGGGDAGRYSCDDAMGTDPTVSASTGQNLHSVSIGGPRATVSGTLTLQDGQDTEIRLRMGRSNDAWCVDDVDL